MKKVSRLRLWRQKPKKPGLPPGTLVGPTEAESVKTTIKVFNYNEKSYSEDVVKQIGEIKRAKDPSVVTWIDITGLRDISMLESVGKLLDLHPLLLEDVVHTEQRPKFEDYDNVLFIVVKMFWFEAEREGISTEQVSLILGKNFVVSLQERPGDVFEPVRQRIREGKGTLRKRGPDYITYMLIDAIVDNYFLILEQIGERIENLEDELLQNPDEKTLHKINDLRQEALLLRRSIWPLRDVVNRFERDESPLIRKDTKIYIRDVYDHTVQVIEALETYRDVLSGMVDLYLSSISNKMNAVMKVLTIIATIFIPLTFIAGVYGMNFKYMPELGWKAGYPLVLIVMAGVAVIMIIYFKRKRWF